MGDDHVIRFDILMLVTSIVHGAVEQFDEFSSRLGWIATRSHSTLAMTDHARSGAAAALVTRAETERNGDRLAADVDTGTVDFDYLGEQVDRLTSGLILDGAADFKAVLDVYIEVDGAGGGHATAGQAGLQHLGVATLTLGTVSTHLSSPHFNGTCLLDLVAPTPGPLWVTLRRVIAYSPR